MAKISGIDVPELTLPEGSAPSTPASTKWKIYTKTDGLYVMDDAGAETGPLGPTGSGSTTLVGASVFDSGAQNLNNGSETTITFESEEYDTDAMHSTVSDTGRLTIASGKDGYYVANFQVAFTGSSSGSIRSVRIYTVTSGPTTTLVQAQQFPDGGATVALIGSVATRPISLVAGDYFEARCYVDGTSLQALSNSAYSPRFSCHRVGT